MRFKELPSWVTDQSHPRGGNEKVLKNGAIFKWDEECLVSCVVQYISRHYHFEQQSWHVLKRLLLITADPTQKVSVGFSSTNVLRKMKSVETQ